MTTPPVACTLTADNLRCNAAVLLPGLSQRAESRVWTSDGIRFVFSPTSENLTAVTETIDRERVCCAFLTFTLTIPAAAGAFVLDVTGPTGTREFLESLRLTHAS
jgi:hypothetical protein